MSYQTTILADAPILSFKHAEASGTTMTDASGNGLDGTYTATDITYEATGPLLAETSLGVTLGGTSGYGTRTLTIGQRPTTPFCLEAWVNAPSAVSGDVVVQLGGQDGLANDVYAQIGVSAGPVWSISMDNGQGDTPSVSSTTAPASGWVHLFARFFSTTERHLYINGKLAASNTGTCELPAQSLDYFVGAFRGTSGFLTGSISHTAYYNADVSPARIAEHYRIGVLNSMVLPVSGARDLLASSYHWQAEVGAASAAAAAAYVEFVGMSPPSSAAWLDSQPTAYTWLPQDDTAEWSAIGQSTGPALWPSSRSVGISLYRKVPSSDADTIDDASVGFLAWIGAIVDDMRTSIETGNYIMADRIIIERWYRAGSKRKTSEGDFHRADIRIYWGSGVGS